MWATRWANLAEPSLDCAALPITHSLGFTSAPEPGATQKLPMAIGCVGIVNGVPVLPRCHDLAKQCLQLGFGRSLDFCVDKRGKPRPGRGLEIDPDFEDSPAPV